ncbi:MAG: methionine adenosyltransferase [Alphaproteobacteria bacterium]|nr:methionine adenosyltransferase [Alphaproteobacteria bacterium]
MKNSQDNFIFTSESVSEGHPDKVCDQISDAILDLFMHHDNNSRVACETLATTNRVILAGEVNLKKNENKITRDLIEKTVREKVKEIGYEQDGFHWNNLVVENHLHKQSQDISIGVDQDEGNEIYGAGDQGIMFGYACNESKNLMPAPIDFSHKILKELSDYRHANDSFFGPDSKSQVSVLYENNKPKSISSIIVSSQHSELASNEDVRKKILDLIENVIPLEILPAKEDILVNPTGRFVVGGPDGDAGLTGRKIIVDTYGGAAPHGGGAFSGKDYTKVDRSAAYMARYLAKNIVASGITKKCLIQLSYAIGVVEPISIFLKIDENLDADQNKIIDIIKGNFDLSPAGIKKFLNLDKPIYQMTASYGHFGRNFEKKTGLFSWESLESVDIFKKI